jgi:hypothetical protein
MMISPVARNPFYERNREHFPDFEIALKPVASFLEEDDENRTTVDHSVCSGGGNTSVLNMSIGARAALNEHLRHVAKFGIDGEKEHDTSIPSDEQSRHYHPDDDVLDEHWENLLDLSKVNSSGDAGSILGAATPPSPLHNIMYASSRNGESDDAIEVMTDVSHDYFNSSRVQLLTTPERYRHRRMDMVVTRDDMSLEALPFGEDESSEDLHPPSLPWNILDESHEEDYQNTTFQSFNTGDISEVRQSPDTSFLSQVHHLDLDTSALSALAGNAGVSPLQPRDTSFPSRPEYRAVSASSSRNKMTLKPPPSTGRGSTQRPPVPIKNVKLGAPQKENVSPESSSDTGNTGSSVMSAVSSFLEEAKSMATYVANELEQSFNGLETLPMDFMRVMDLSGVCRNNPPSPISSAESKNHSSSQDSAKQKSEHQENDNCISSKSKDEAILLGRKRYRTVVPRRLYQATMDSAMEEEQDSFLAVRSNPETQRSHGESLFSEHPDAVAVRTTF